MSAYARKHNVVTWFQGQKVKVGNLAIDKQAGIILKLQAVYRVDVVHVTYRVLLKM